MVWCCYGELHGFTKFFIGNQAWKITLQHKTVDGFYGFQRPVITIFGFMHALKIHHMQIMDNVSAGFILYLEDVSLSEREVKLTSVFQIHN